MTQTDIASDLTPGQIRARKAVATRRARGDYRARQAQLAAGVETPSVIEESPHVMIDMWIDDATIGCGMRRFIPIEVGPRVVRLFRVATLQTIKVDRLTFDERAKPVECNRKHVARILRANRKQAERINAGKAKPVLCEGGKDAVTALAILEGRH